MRDGLGRTPLMIAAFATNDSTVIQAVLDTVRAHGVDISPAGLSTAFHGLSG